MAVSTDPDNDDAASATAFAEQFGLGERLHFLLGDRGALAPSGRPTTSTPPRCRPRPPRRSGPPPPTPADRRAHRCAVHHRPPGARADTAAERLRPARREHAAHPVAGIGGADRGRARGAPRGRGVLYPAPRGGARGAGRAPCRMRCRRTVRWGGESQDPEIRRGDDSAAAPSSATTVREPSAPDASPRSRSTDVDLPTRRIRRQRGPGRRDDRDVARAGTRAWTCSPMGEERRCTSSTRAPTDGMASTSSSWCRARSAEPSPMNEPLASRVGPTRRRGVRCRGRPAVAKGPTPAWTAEDGRPGPMTVVDSTYDEAYGDEAALAMDVAAALNAELLDLQAAGCDVVQIDEPAMTRYHEKVAAYGAARARSLPRGVTIPTIVHLCYGYPGRRRPAARVRVPGAAGDADGDAHRRLLGRVRAQRLRSGDPRARCGDRLVMYGCVDPATRRPEPLRSSSVASGQRWATSTRAAAAGPRLRADDDHRDLARAEEACSSPPRPRRTDALIASGDEKPFEANLATWRRGPWARAQRRTAARPGRSGQLLDETPVFKTGWVGAGRP